MFENQLLKNGNGKRIVFFSYGSDDQTTTLLHDPVKNILSINFTLSQLTFALDSAFSSLRQYYFLSIKNFDLSKIIINEMPNFFL